MTVAGDEVEVALLEEKVFDAAHDGGGVAVADLGDDDADGEAALGAQGAGKEVGSILEFSGGGEDAVFRFLGDGVGDRGAVDDQGDGGGGERQVFRQPLQTHWFSRGMPGSVAAGSRLPGGHGAKSRTMKPREQVQDSETGARSTLDFGGKNVFHTDRCRSTNAF